MLPELLQAMDAILRRHVVHASRPASIRVKDGFEAMQLAVGFADPRAACDVALAILESLAADGTLPPARAGAAYGDVLVRDADVYGPVVNLAARATKAARTGCLVVSEELRHELDNEQAWTFEPLPPQELKGFDPTARFEVRTAALPGSTPSAGVGDDRE